MGGKKGWTLNRVEMQGRLLNCGKTLPPVKTGPAAVAGSQSKRGSHSILFQSVGQNAKVLLQGRGGRKVSQQSEPVPTHAVF